MNYIFSKRDVPMLGGLEGKSLQARVEARVQVEARVEARVEAMVRVCRPGWRPW